MPHSLRRAKVPRLPTVLGGLQHPQHLPGHSQVQECSSPKQERCTPAARDSPVCIAWPWGCSWGGPLAWLRCPKRMPQQTRAIARNQTFICLFLFIFFFILNFFFLPHKQNLRPQPLSFFYADNHGITPTLSFRSLLMVQEAFNLLRKLWLLASTEHMEKINK